MNQSNPKILSLFTGAGGLDLGFEAAGFDIVAASDIMKESCETIRLNRPNIKVFGPPESSGDIADLTSEFIYKETGLNPGDIDVMLGGPPCQTFSVAAAQRFLKTDAKFKRRGFDSKKGSLVFEYLRLITEIKPKVFVIENVPGFATIDGGKTIDSLKTLLKDYNYNVQGPFLVKTEEYGVPQARRRVIIVGVLEGATFNFPLPTHTSEINLWAKKQFVTTAQALISINKNAKNFETRIHKDESLKRYKSLKIGQREKLGRVDRLNPNTPSKTIIAGGSNGGGRSHLHPFEARTLSVRESAKLQTFPDNYEFSGKIGRQFTQVGNAVPPLFAEILARAIGEQYFNKSYHNQKLVFEIPEINPKKAYEILKKNSIQKNCVLYDDVLENEENTEHKVYDTYTNSFPPQFSPSFMMSSNEKSSY
jgi:DNA (cytosine-5)-methyltransferase 1